MRLGGIRERPGRRRNVSRADERRCVPGQWRSPARTVILRGSDDSDETFSEARTKIRQLEAYFEVITGAFVCEVRATSHQHTHTRTGITHGLTLTHGCKRRADCTQQKARLTRRKQKKTLGFDENHGLRGAGDAGARRRDARARRPTRKNARSVPTKNCQYYLRERGFATPCFPPGNFSARARFRSRAVPRPGAIRRTSPRGKQRTRSTRDDDTPLKIINFSVTRQYHVRVTLFGGNGHHVFVKAAIGAAL